MRLPTASENGQERGFEIAGIAEETLAKFSQRSEQRDLAIAAFAEENGRMPSNGEIAVLVRESRADKLLAISTEEVKAQQASRLTPTERAQLETLYDQAQQHGPRREQGEAAASLLYAREHVFERVSVAQEHELKREALQHGRGLLDLAELKTAALREEQAGVLLKAGRDVATSESLARERQMVAAINQGQGQYARLGGADEFTVSDRLRPEQKQAVEVVLDSRDLAVNLRGAAGTGKTATLQEIQRGVAEGGREIVAVAPTRSAVEELARVGFAQALTVERLLQDPREQERLRGQVLVVDEAGMVSSRQMSRLLELATDGRAQIVFSGDTRQIQSVEAGDALRVLERESHLRSVSLSQVQRQTLAAYRGAVEELRQDPARGFKRLEEMGAVREVEWSLRPQEVSKAYRAALAQPNAQGQSCQVLVVAPTHEEIRRLTEVIRADRERAGELGESQPMAQHVPLHWTEAQKKQTHKYRPGLVLEFHKATRDVAKNEAVEVVAVEKDQLRARKESGEEITLTRRQAQAFAVYERKEIVGGCGGQAAACRESPANRVSSYQRRAGDSGQCREWSHSVGRWPHAAVELPAVRSRLCSHGPSQSRQDGRCGHCFRRSDVAGAVLCGRYPWAGKLDDCDERQGAATGIDGDFRRTDLGHRTGPQSRRNKHTWHRLPELTLGQDLASAGHWALRQAIRQEERWQLPEQALAQAQSIEGPEPGEETGATTSNMAMASASDGGWASQREGTDRCAPCCVELRQRTYVLPWSLFLFAEGTDAEVRLTFHTHVILVQGAGLTSLLSDLAEQNVKQLVEPDRTAKFQPARGPHITAVSLTENK